MIKEAAWNCGKDSPAIPEQVDAFLSKKVEVVLSPGRPGH